MRVLFTTLPDKSLFLPMAPLAWALRTAGHEVRVASMPKLTDVITQAGLTAVPVGRDRDGLRILDMEPGARAAVRMGLPEPYDVADHPEKASWEYLQAGYTEAVTWWHKMDNFPMVADLVAFARAWRPDLVIWEPLNQAGAIAARAVGAAHARILWGMDVFGVTRAHFLELQKKQPPEDRGDPLAEWLGANAVKYGTEFAEEMVSGHFTIGYFPDSLRLPTDLPYVPMRYVPYGGPAVVPSWLWAPPQRPRVGLTLGVTATERFDGYIVGVQDVLDSLSDLDIEIVATLADAERDKLARIPDNTRIVPFVPLHALVATCSAVIHHAGPGTLATTSVYAVPQLALPWDFDEPALARNFAATGAGITVPANEATGQLVRESLLRLLNDPQLRAGADRLRAEMAAMPTPNEVVGQLEELTTKYRAS